MTLNQRFLAAAVTVTAILLISSHTTGTITTSASSTFSLSTTTRSCAEWCSTAPVAACLRAFCLLLNVLDIGGFVFSRIAAACEKNPRQTKGWRDFD